MSIKVSSYVWDHSQHSGGALLVLLAIADGASTIATLGQKARLSPRQLKRILRDLEDSGELTINSDAGMHGEHLFTVNLEAMKGCTHE